MSNDNDDVMHMWQLIAETNFESSEWPKQDATPDEIYCAML